MNRIIYLFILFSFICLSCICKSPTNSNNDPPPDNDTIPSTMPQQHIPWPSLADSPWPMYRHDPQGTGRSQYPGPQLGQLKWKMSAPGVASGNGFTSTVIDPNGTLYIPSSYEREEGIGQIWKFHAINPNGTIKWTWFDSIHPHNEIESVPLITADGTIILCGMGLPQSYIYGINPDGTLKWEYYVDSQPSNPNIGLDGTIYFTTINGLYALKQDGTLKWELRKNTEFGPSTDGISISTDGQILFVGGWSGYDKLFAISTNGDILWSFNDDDSTKYYSLSSIPMVDSQNNIYIYTTYGLYSVSHDGKERWRYKHLSTGEQMVMDFNGHLYIYDYIDINTQKITALNYAGQELWSIDHHYLQSGLVMDNNGTIYTIGNNEVSAISSFDGSIIWELYLGYSYHSWYTPAIPKYRTPLSRAGVEGNKFLYAIE